MAEDNNGAYNSGRDSDIQISRTPSRDYNQTSPFDLMVARDEVNRQTQQFLDQVKNMTTEINSILKSVEQSNTRGSKALADSARMYLATMENAQKKGEMSVETQLDFMKQYSKILADAAKRQITMTDATKEQVNNANRMLDISRQYAQEAERLQKALEGSADNLANRISKTIHTIREDFQGLANTLNIDKLVNGSSISSRIDIMNQTKQNFGLTTNREFEVFKNDLINQMQGLNDKFGQSLLGSNDLKNYLQMSSQIGLTETSIAQDQLEALLLGNKYLGESIETQSQLYKYMKRTGDTDITNKYNKMIVGLLQSDLNVSKEQLDAFNRQNLEQLDYLNTLGWSADEQENALKNMNALQTAAADLGLDGESIMGALNTLYNSGVDNGAPELLGSSFQKFREQYRSQDFLGALNTLVNESNFQGISSATQGAGSNDSIVFNALKDSLGLDGSMISELTKASSKLSEINANYTVADEAIDQSMSNENAVTDYVKDTTVASLEERLMNKLGLIFDQVPWNAFVTMGNVAFTMFVAEKGFSALSSLVNFFKGGGFSKLLSSFTGSNSIIGKGMNKLGTFLGGGGKLGSILGSVATVGGGITLGLGAANIIKGAIESATNKKQSSNISAAQKQLEGTSLEGNTAAASALGFADTYADDGANKTGDFGSAFATTTRGIGVGLLGWTRDLSTINQDDWKFFRESLAMRKMNKEDIMAYTTAWALLLMSAGRQTDVDEFSSYTAEDIHALIKEYGWTRSYLDAVAADSSPKPNKTKKEDQETIDWNGLGLSNVGGAGDRAGLGANMGGSSVPSGYPWTGTAGYPTYPSGRKHTGVDFGIPTGTPVGAAISGTVAQVNDSGSKGYGRHVIVQGDNGKWFVYGHLSQPKVSKGQHVDAGNLIGLSGNTGNSTGPHLHFEARNNSRYGSDISPYPYITNGLFTPNGTASGALVKGNTTSDSEDDSQTPQAQQSSTRYSTRFVSSRFSRSLNMGGPDLDINQEDPLISTMNKRFDDLISVITSLSDRQDADSMILQALSNSTRRPVEFGGGR